MDVESDTESNKINHLAQPCCPIWTGGLLNSLARANDAGRYCTKRLPRERIVRSTIVLP